LTLAAHKRIMQQVREDFDRLAVLMADEYGAPDRYANYLLRHVPVGCNHALEIGCGLGSFARLVARRARQVTAIDLSPQMIKFARERSTAYANLQFVPGDFLKLDLPAEAYDCIVTVATLHHLPSAEVLARMKSLLRAGGVLVIHDLLATDGYVDYAFNAVRLSVNMALRFFQRGRFRQRPEVRRAWEEHGKHESYLKAKEVRAMRDEHLPGGRVYSHLLWRYTIIWRKPEKPIM
jgi:ubiquinone/menaquinone biosynthesis C-methylase UbiE